MAKNKKSTEDEPIELGTSQLPDRLADATSSETVEDVKTDVPQGGSGDNDTSSSAPSPDGQFDEVKPGSGPGVS